MGRTPWSFGVTSLVLEFGSGKSEVGVEARMVDIELVQTCERAMVRILILPT